MSSPPAFRREALGGDGRRYTYASLRDEVRAFAKGLHALDLAICSLGGVMVGHQLGQRLELLEHREVVVFQESGGRDDLSSLRSGGTIGTPQQFMRVGRQLSPS